MKFIIGKKIEMNQIFRNDEVFPVTIVKAGKCVVTQIKKSDKDKYEAIQLGFGSKSKLNKPQKGHLKNLGNFRYLKEFRLDKPNLTETNTPAEPIKIGDEITVKVFNIGDKVNVIGSSKGKGFQGVVRRHGFHGSPKTHGHKDQLRMPGSIGATEPARVFKGMRMAGHMGSDRVTVKNLEVIEIDEKNDLLKIKGAMPGARNGLVLISCEGVMNLAKEEETVKTESVNQAPTQEIKKEDKEKEDIKETSENKKELS